MTLRLDWCSYKAAKAACERWHYSGSLSSARNVYIGVWEDGVFIGVVVFGIGSGGATNGSRYGLKAAKEMAELTRVALGRHDAPVSRIVAIAISIIRKQSPGIRLLISMADPRQGHHGGIYQAGNWIYTGETAPDVEYFCNGQWRHHRSAGSLGSVKGLPSRKIPPKHRYLMPLDEDMRKRIEPLRKPYPKRPKPSSEAAGHQPAEGGAEPTRTLQILRAHDVPA